MVSKLHQYQEHLKQLKHKFVLNGTEVMPE